MPSQPTVSTKTTLWIWPTGHFPRRLVYYFRAKGFSSSLLAAHNINLIPVIYDMKQGDLVSKSGYEDRPKNRQLPCLRIEKEGTEPFFIQESSAIMEYFEEIFGVEDGYIDLIGATPEQRARTRGIVGLMNDAILWMSLHLINSDESTLFWSGLKREEWSEHTSADSLKRKNQLVSRLESWVHNDVVMKGCKSLSGQGAEVTIADLALMVAMTYNEDHYGKDFLEGHEILKKWIEEAKKETWYIDKAGLEKIEEMGFECLFEGLE